MLTLSSAAKALESLFYLSQTVTDYEEMGNEEKISSIIVKGIKKYIDWSLRDAGMDGTKTESTIMVLQFSPDFRGDGEHDSMESGFTSSGGDTSRDVIRFTRAVDKELEKRFHELGQRWRALLWDNSSKRFRAEPPTLYALSVVQHVVMLTSHDSSNSMNPVVVLDQINLNERGLWLWNALSIALPVNMARDGLCKLWDTGVIKRRSGLTAGPDPDR
jgi:hypothetical protein